ncbi:asparagine synthase-related protein [Tenacibaculum finnmarkense]|uniref:asparagine synthase-related protein n=1 Tax=Tenacibaculum finnmarkense TaxID=2781243 RepID=UPI001E58E41A|nr:asparagine synthase C-terminal domain-containing protein [Tenacibaculum finnmarkense]MCD8423125.1 asparagine synthase C-terminal domain-containing protein [Tenacibaculum finnmarkense genomovar ulcerans]MCG8239340.1 hypothetical protein [Tenacibaculum finnmarkense genomovar ulcerans]MCG8796168.1 hypothetical protein [Tenacibaculum finnmarkense]MCG8798276.1 hypothetical protein [Tenacibaculum finnmarkense]
MNLFLENNEGFKWAKYKNVFFKGNFLFKSDLYDSNTFNENNDSFNLDILEEVSFKKIYGQFLIVIKENDKIIIITDCVRSFNLLYQETALGFVISDSIDKLKIKSINKEGLSEFKYTGFITNNDTIYRDIKSLESCKKYVFTKNEVTSEYYFNFKYNQNLENENILNKITSIYDLVFKDFITSIGNKTIVVPLSGGYDSRIIIQYLHKFKVPNKIICYTYGIKGNEESSISKEVANYYGYEWHFIEYNKEKWSKSNVLKYTEQTFDGVSLPHIQDFLALSELKKTKLIPDDAVFVPGHSGDFIAGSHLNNRVLNCKTKEVFIFEILWKNYFLNFSIKFQKLYNLVSKRLGNNIKSSNFVNSFEEWNFKERQAKFIVNSARVYEHFGYEWKMPLWDIRLIDFWLTIKNEERLNRKLYFDFISSNDKWHTSKNENNLVNKLQIHKYYLKWGHFIYLNTINFFLGKKHPMGWFEIFNNNSSLFYSSINSLLVRNLISKIKNKF